MDMDEFILILAGLFILAMAFFGIGIYLSTRSKQKGALRRERSASLPLDKEIQKESILEIARLLRDEQSGALMIEENGVIYHKATDLSPELRRLLAVAVDDLQSFLASMPAPQSQVARPASSTTPATESDVSADISPRITMAGQASTEAQVKSPSMNPVDIITRAVSSDVPKVDLKSKTITAQIDEILQEILVNTPLEQRGIRLLDAPDGRVVVFVGIESYDGVDTVPDDEVRQAIRAAVAEWEKRNTQSI